MGHIHSADEIDFQNPRPVGGFEIPEGESKFPRADSNRKNNVIYLLERSREMLNGSIVRDISQRE